MSRNPKSGILTFLFTDLEDSTILWEKFPGMMRHALTRHDKLLREVVEQHHGQVVKSTGDGLHAVFTAASAGVSAAVAMQLAMAAETWPDETGPLKVRIGLHAGESQERGGDYYGPDVNRAARVMGVGHGGQILLTETTTLLLRSSPPPELSLVDLGEFLLKGFASPERIFQASYPGLPADFPQLKAAPRHITNLPVQPNALIGRQREIAEAAALLRRKDIRLLTLTGPGGTGKTRLGLELAENIKDEFEDGAFFISLAEIRDPALLPSTIAKLWDIRVSGQNSLLEGVKAYLQYRSLLLVLDNFEQILEAGPVVAELLSSASRMNVLVTSREPLHLYSEYTYPVPPLELPAPDNLPSLDRLIQFEAVRLFIERAQAVKHDFTLSKENALAVAEICRRLDGLPLAIELAAARIRLFPPRTMLARMERRISLLVGGARDLPQRQQTLNHAISWSHDLLSESEKILFRRLSVFSSAALEAVEAVCIADYELGDSLYGDLESLVDKSLIKQEPAGGDVRFGMLKTIREYAQNKLEEAGELEAIRDRQLGYFLKLSQEASAGLMRSDQAQWLARMEAERANLRSVLEWGLKSARRTMAGVQMLSSLINLINFWQFRGDQEEWFNWFDLALENNAGALPSLRAHLLEGKGMQALLKGNYEQARDNFDQALALYREAENRENIGLLLAYRAQTALGLGDFAGAHQFAEMSLDTNYGEDDWRTAAGLFDLGDAAYLQGHFEEAQQNYAEGLALVEDWGSAFPVALRNVRLAQVAVALGNTGEAAAHLHRALTLADGANDHMIVAMALGCLASQEMNADRPEAAARLLGAARSKLDSFGINFYPMDQFLYDRTLGGVRDILGDKLFTAIWGEGRVMASDETIAYAIETMTYDQAFDPAENPDHNTQAG
jgi:predicted ATPase/class 3 adenylate cyclase